MLAHGIRQIKARTQMAPLADALECRGINTHFADYGYVLMPTTNQRAVQAIHNAARDGEDVAAYSNGAWAAVQAAYQGLRIRHLYLISPALNVSTKFPANIERITVFYSPHDTVTPMGKAWRQLTRVLPWRWKNPHGWGEMGTRGPDSDDPRISAVSLPMDVDHGTVAHQATVDFIADRIEVTA